MAGEIIRSQGKGGAIALSLRPLLGDEVRDTTDLRNYHILADDDRWHTRAINAPSAVEQRFIEATANVKKLPADKLAKARGGAK